MKQYVGLALLAALAVAMLLNSILDVGWRVLIVPLAFLFVWWAIEFSYGRWWYR